MIMTIRFIMISLLIGLIFNIVDLYKLGEPVPEPCINITEIIFEANEYDTTKEIFMIDLR